MQTIDTPVITMEDVLGRGRETNLTGQRKGVAVKMCREHLNEATLQLKGPRCLIDSVSLFSLNALLTRGAPFLCAARLQSQSRMSLPDKKAGFVRKFPKRQPQN